MKKRFLSFLCMMALVFTTGAFTTTASALSNGAYIIGRTTSYVNPETGTTVDGGTNIALGDSMCASIIEDHMLVEKVDGKTYVTIGVGLMSNVQNVRIQVRNSNGSYSNVSITQTGSCTRNGDGCNHYRFQVPSESSYISPILYVAPMGRDVQFFVIPDVSSAQAGTGNFVSQMIPQNTQNATTEAAGSKGESAKTEDKTTENTKTEKDSEAKDEQVNPEAEVKQDDVDEKDDKKDSDVKQEKDKEKETDKKEESQDEKDNTPVIIGGIAIVVVAAAVGCYFLWKRKKGEA